MKKEFFNIFSFIVAIENIGNQYRKVAVESGKLSRAFIKLLVIAGLIAMPLGYAAGFLFLHNFADRISFGPVSALLCFSFLLIIGLITIISQTHKAAIENPAKNLRND